MSEYTDYLCVDRCPSHGYYAISTAHLRQDGGGGGTRLTHGKCCGSWRTLTQWEFPAEDLKARIIKACVEAQRIQGEVVLILTSCAAHRNYGVGIGTRHGDGRNNTYEVLDPCPCCRDREPVKTWYMKPSHLAYGVSYSHMEVFDLQDKSRALGLSVACLAEKLGVTRNTIRKWFSGRATPSQESRYKIRALELQHPG